MLICIGTEVEVEQGQKWPGTTACVKHCCDLSQYTDLQRPSSSKILVLISSEVEVYDLEMLK